MEKILEITTIENYLPPTERYGGYDGYLIRTDEQAIYLLIENGQSCCESWGYFLSEDDTSAFIGAELRSITKTNMALNTEVVKRHEAEDLEQGAIMFVNLETDRGTLQFAAYNAHNGYYGHDAKIISKQLTEEETL